MSSHSPSRRAQKDRFKIEVRLRQQLQDEFFDEGEYGIRKALEGLHSVVVTSADPRMALAAALYVFMTWICHPSKPDFEVPLDRFLDGIRDDKDTQTVAFVNGLEFIALKRLPVVDYDALYVQQKVA